MVEKIFGWAGKILRVNLSTGKILTESTMSYAERFIGGRGVNQWVLFNETPLNIDAFDPQNPLLFGAGPLVGTLAPAACRITIETKNAFNGGTSWANAGGYFAPELKFAGFDHVMITGRAEKPVYLSIMDGNAELRDASKLWGKTTWNTEDIVREDIGDKNVRVACIGPAGEHLARAAAVIFDRHRAAGGGGAGAVMGSKNLKAIAVRGKKPIEVADPEKFISVVDEVYKKIDAAKFAFNLRKMGTYGTYSSLDWECITSMRNAQDDCMEPGKFHKTSYDEISKYLVHTASCFACPIYCSRTFKLADGTISENIEENGRLAFAGRMDIEDPVSVLKAHALYTQLGLDIDNTTVVISWAFECYERGILRKEDVDGLKLMWGDTQAFFELVRKLAYRDGFGNTLAEGVKRASEKIGRGSEYYASHNKGQDMLDALRVPKGWGFGVATSVRGGRHLSGATCLEFAGISPEEGERLFGEPTIGDPRSYEGKPKAVFWTEQFKAVVDSVGLCVFTTFWTGDPGLLGISDIAKLFESATGLTYSDEELLLIGRRIYNLEKAFNTLHVGFTRKDDLPPQRLMREPIQKGQYVGELCHKDKWEKMLDEYYTLHGWDPKTSWQTRKILEKLDLKEIADKLEETGKLIAT